MPVVTRTFPLHTNAGDIINITRNVQDSVDKSRIREGTATVFCPGSTGAISTIEFEPGLVKTDVPFLLDKLVDPNRDWAHHKTWGDHNGAGHLLSFLIKTSFTVPFTQGHLLLGIYQQIIFLELDEKAREREIIVQIIGE
jgi:secondary thiamine-phosphate synthase enzyme